MSTGVRQYLRDVFGPANEWDQVPEGTCVGTSDHLPFSVGLSLAWREEFLMQPDDADALADLLKTAAAKARAKRDAAEAAIKDARK